MLLALRATLHGSHATCIAGGLREEDVAGILWLRGGVGVRSSSAVNPPRNVGPGGAFPLDQAPVDAPRHAASVTFQPCGGGSVDFAENHARSVSFQCLIPVRGSNRLYSQCGEAFFSTLHKIELDISLSRAV